MPQSSRGWSPLPTGAGAAGGTTGNNPPGWYVLCNGNSWSVVNGSGAAVVGTDGIAHGPFSTWGDASSYGSTTNPCTPSPSGGSGAGGQAPPTPTQPPSGGAGSGGVPPADRPWWVVCYPDGTAGVAQASSAAAVTAGGQASVGAGPFASQQFAQNFLDGSPELCKSKPAPSCAVKPLFNCPQIPQGVTAWGVPGSELWCSRMQQLVDGLSAVGNAVFSFVDGVMDMQSLIGKIDASIADKWPWDWVKGLLSLLRQVLCWVGPYIETLREAIKCARAISLHMFPDCSPDALLGLLSLRALLHTLQHIELGTDAAAWIIAHSGIRIDPIHTILESLIQYACPVEIPSEADAVEAYKYNTINDKIAKCILRAHGKQWETALPSIIARGEKPGWKELMQYVRRIGGNADTEDSALRNAGVLDDSYRAVLQTIYDELPSIGDHLEWLRKNVFDGDYVRDFQLMSGFEEKFWPKFGTQLRALGMTKENAGLHYAAHWINPSFGQQFEMVQRLRPGRVDPSLVFTRNDLLRTMQEMDVGVYFRERLERVSHPVPNLTLCLQMYQFGTVNDAEFVEKLKDLGYDDDNAKQILAAQVIKVRRLNASSGHAWTPGSLASAYSVGRLSAEQVNAEMAYLGYSKDDADRLMRRAEIELAAAPIRRIQQQTFRSALTTQQNAYKCGAIDAESLLGVYRNAGMPDDIAKIAIADVDSGIAVGLCGQQVQTFRNALLKGKATVDQIRELMLNSGIPLLRVTQYLKSWVIEAQLKGPSATAAQILRWAGTGLLDAEVARQRLLTLGWSDPDLTLLLAESSTKLRRAAERAQQLAAKSQQSAAKQALSLEREAQALASKLRSRLRGIASIATLQKWVKDGLMTDPEFIDYATARGYDLVDAERYLADAHLKASAAKKPPKAKLTPEVTGNGTAQETPPAQP